MNGKIDINQSNDFLYKDLVIWITCGFMLMVLGMEFLSIYLGNGGVFTYTLDDPYIHMTLADQILQGHYGIATGINASPSSSIIWPLLLLPFMAIGGSWSLYGPLILNFVLALALVIVIARLWKHILGCWKTPADRGLALLLIVISLLVFNIPGLVFTGMEHTLQLFLVVTSLLGLILEGRENRVPRWLPVVLILGPLVRYELLAISGAALIYLFFRKHRRLTIITAVAIFFGVGGFSLFLHTQGLPWIPASIISKSAFSWLGPIEGLTINISRSLHHPTGLFLILMGILNIGLALKLQRPSAERLLAMTLTFAALAHVFLGSYGMYNRYEVYAWTFLLLGTLYGIKSVFRPASIGKKANRDAMVARVLLLMAMLVAGNRYIEVLYTTPLAARNIMDQQYQMGRLAKNYLKEPVAVNDLGLISWRNPQPVLDLVGLGNLEALHFRLQVNADPSWMDSLCKKYGVTVVMIYERVFFPMLPKNWKKIAQWRLSGKNIVCGRPIVSIFVTRESSLPRILPLVHKWAKTLPLSIGFRWTITPDQHSQVSLSL